MQQHQDQTPAVLTMGFSPAAAVATWRLAKTGIFRCYTFWPTSTVHFQSEVFGADQVYQAENFDFSNPKQISSSKSFAIVILVVPTIKEVARMCRKIQPVISKHTMVLVDVSGGIAPLQRLVKSNLGSGYQITGLICDVDAEFSVKQNQWTVLHRKLGQSTQTITLEPSGSQAKMLQALETAWTAGGLTATRTKTSGAFGEIQWQRTIGVVVFEVLTVALDIPEPEKLASSLIAKPITEGLVGELTMVAAASGIKGLPSKSQLLNRGPKLARRAPNTFKNPNASRVYYDVYRKASVALDFLVLLPILLSDELPKGGATPYLESLYAYMSRMLDMNMDVYKSELFQRVDASASSGGTASVDPAVIAKLDSRSKALDAKESELEAKEKRYQEVLEELRVQQQQHSERVAQLDNQWAQNERRLQSFEELNARAEQLRQREEQMTDTERKFLHRERGMKQRELDLVNREQALISRENELLSRSEALAGGSLSNGGVSHHQLPQAPQQQAQAQQSQQQSPQQQVPMTPGGTVYSRFDPRAPPVAQTQAPPPQQNGAAANGGPNFYGVPASSSASIVSSARPRQSYGGPAPPPPQLQQPGPSRHGSRVPLASPAIMQPGGFYPPGPPPPQQQQQQYMNGRGRKPPRRMSMNDDAEVPSTPGGRRRQQSMPNNVYGNGAGPAGPSAQPSNLFSQNFELDGVMAHSTDRYHFVSRARTKQKDIKLSSDEDAYQASRKFLHGAGHLSSPSMGYANSVHSVQQYDNHSSSAYPGVPSSRSFKGAGDVSHGSTQTRRSMGNVLANAGPPPSSQPAPVAATSAEASRSMLPTNVIPAGPDFSNFNFGDGLDGTNRAAAGASSGSTGSQNLSSNGSNGTPSRSRSGTPPTPLGTIDPSVLSNAQKWENNNNNSNSGSNTQAVSFNFA